MEGHIIWKNKEDKVMMDATFKDATFRDIDDIAYSIYKHGLIEGDRLEILIFEQPKQISKEEAEKQKRGQIEYCIECGRKLNERHECEWCGTAY